MMMKKGSGLNITTSNANILIQKKNIYHIKVVTTWTNIKFF